MNRETLDSKHEYEEGNIFYLEEVGRVMAIKKINIGDTILLGVNCLPC